jgi:hypothetical protein
MIDNATGSTLPSIQVCYKRREWVFEIWVSTATEDDAGVSKRKQHSLRSGPLLSPLALSNEFGFEKDRLATLCMFFLF